MVTFQELRTGLAALPETISEYGLVPGLRRWTGLVYTRLGTTVDGRSLFDEEWDICVVLDACRADELRAQRDRFEWLDDVGEFDSLGSSTYNWLPRTVAETPRETLQETTYVSANPFSGELLEGDEFGQLDEVYRYAWDDDRGTVLPRPVTDRAITHWRESNCERLLVHYLQPHVPFLTGDADSLSRSNFTHGERSVPDAWDEVTRGTLDREDAIRQYRETLTLVLEDVSLLLSSVNADDVVVTADHGEAFGEMGLYGHPPETGLDCLTKVPWVETTATDRRGYDPATYDTDVESYDATDQLDALGYA